MNAMASQITSLTIVYSAVYSGKDERKHQSSASLAFVRGIHRWPVNSPHKGPVTQKMFPFDDVIMMKRARTCINLKSYLPVGTCECYSGYKHCIFHIKTFDISAICCPDLNDPANGIMMTTSTDNVIGTVVVFRCDSGYELLGDDVLDCVEVNGEAVWDGQPPICRDVD